MKEKLLKFTTVLVSILLLSLLISKSMAAGNCAFSVGANFDGIDTTSETMVASSCYGQMGYNSYYSTQPTFDILNGYFQNGTRRVESDILFISGHGRDDGKRIRVLNTGIITGATREGFVGVNNVNWGTTKLVVYAGCSTARESESNNLTVETYRSGADTVLGWHQAIDAVSHQKWLNRFNNKLASGATFSESFIYASSFTDYRDDRVKDLGVYGNWNTIYRKSNNKKNLEEINTVEVKKDMKYIYEEQNIDAIVQLIKSRNPNFNKNDYEMNIFTLNEEDMIYTIDFIHKIDDFKTDLGYSIAIMNGQVVSLTENDKDIIEIENKTAKLNIYEEYKQQEIAGQLALKDALNNKMSNVKIKEQIANYYYDTKENKKYYNIFSTVESDDGYIRVIEYSREI